MKEQDSEPIYAATFLGNLMIGIKAIVMDAPPTLQKLNSYRRFLKVPSVLSFFFALATWLLYLELSWFVFSGFWGGVIFMFFLSPSIIFCLYVRDYTKWSLSRRRVWKWANGKFYSWDQLNRWITKTAPADLEEISKLPDDAWEPNVTDGGIIK